jgi:hypothetical protein
LYPQADAVTVKVTDHIEFISTGENLERVRCPACATELDFAWWTDAMDAAYRGNFNNTSVTVPCCLTITSLDQLHYEGPTGFARFEVSVTNPGRALDDQDLQAVEQVVGSSLRAVWEHL